MWVGWGAGAACTPKDAATHVGFVDAPVSAVATQIAGKVVIVGAREGDRVQKGQLLARLEASTYEAAVAQAEANVDRARQAVAVAEGNLTAALPAVAGASADIARARAARDVAELDFDRVEHLAASGALPPSELDATRARLLESRASLDAMIAARAGSQGRLATAHAALNDARAGVRSAEAALRLAQAQLDQTRIVSPFDGLVVSHNVEEGEWAGPGTPIVTVEDTSRPWVRLDVEETAFGKLRLQQVAAVRLVALPDRTYRAHVAEVGAEADFALDRDVKRGRPDVRTFLVRVAFDELPPLLRPGMTAEVRLTDEAIPAGAAGSSGAAGSTREAAP